MAASLVTFAYVVQIALFGAAGTLFIRAFLDQQKLRRGEAAAQPAAERARRLRFFYKPAPLTPASRALTRRIGRELAFGALFLILAPLAPALLTLLSGPGS